MPDRIAVSDALDLLAFVPELIGFEPHNSLVLVALRGQVSCGTLRVDLPGDELAREDLADFVSKLVGMLCRIPGATALVPVVFTEGSCSTGTPRADLFARLNSAARAAGFTVREELYVAADGWGRAGDPPRSSDELDAARRLRRLDPDSTAVGASPAEEAALPEVDRKLVKRTGSALASHRLEGQIPDPIWFAEYSSGWDPVAVGPAGAALTAAVLGQPWARDVVLFTWAWGSGVGRRALRFQERHRRGEPVIDKDVALAFGGLGDIGRPRVDAVVRAVQLLRQVAARLPEGERCPCLASLSWLNWALGRGSIAGEYARAALAVDPGYGFAQLVHTMLEHGLLPGWSFDDTTVHGSRGRSRPDAFGGMRR